LFKLRHYHIQEIRSFHIDETFLLIALNRDNRLEITKIVNPVESALIIRRQLHKLYQLKRERKLRYEALLNRHVDELDNLSNFKAETGI
jgi:hypothetical protein